MKRISVIGSVHREQGSATSMALLTILGQLQPEVIFLEQSEAAFRDYCSESRMDLESKAVCRYRQLHSVTLVPVDLPTPPLEALSWQKATLDSLFDAVEAQSPHFSQLRDAEVAYTIEYGFDFLNSPYCTALCTELEKAEFTAVDSLDDEHIRQSYLLWRETNDRREAGMLGNIVDYCQHRSFAKAVFLVGSAHRLPLYNKTRKGSAAASGAIDWVFPGLFGPGDGRVGGSASP